MAAERKCSGGAEKTKPSAVRKHSVVSGEPKLEIKTQERLNKIKEREKKKGSVFKESVTAGPIKPISLPH